MRINDLLYPPRHTDTERLDALLNQPNGVIIIASDGRIDFYPHYCNGESPVTISSCDLPLTYLLDELVEYKRTVDQDHCHMVVPEK